MKKYQMTVIVDEMEIDEQGNYVATSPVTIMEAEADNLEVIKDRGVEDRERLIYWDGDNENFSDVHQGQMVLLLRHDTAEKESI